MSTSDKRKLKVCKYLKNKLFYIFITALLIGTSASQFVYAPGPTPATPGVLYGTDGQPNHLLTVSKTTGSGTTVALITPDVSPGLISFPSLAVDPVTKFLYAGGGRGNPIIYVVNAATGAATMVGNTGLGFAAVSALDFDPTSGMLFASVNIAGDGGTGGDHLATIDKVTGAATVIGSFGTCTGVITPSTGLGSCTIEGIEALAVDLHGNMYAASTTRQGFSIGPALYSINKATGHATLIAPILDSTAGFPSGGIASLEFDAGGTLYAGTAKAVLPATDGGDLGTIDPATGLYSLIGKAITGGGSSLAALATIPSPPPAPTITSPSNGAITNDNTPAISGNAQTGSTVEVFIDSVSAGTTTAMSPWSFTPTTALSDGTHIITATAANEGGTSPLSAAVTITVDTIPPAPTFSINSGNPAQTFSRSVSIETACNDGPVGSGCATFVVGGSGISDPTIGPSEPFAASRPAELTFFQASKTAQISDVADFAGNVFAGPATDAIALEPSITGIVSSTPDEFWGVGFSYSGNVNNMPSSGVRTITFTYGNNVVPGVAITDANNDGDGTFSLPATFAKPPGDTAGPNPSSAALLSGGVAVTELVGGAPVTAAGPSVDMKKHPIILGLNAVQIPPADGPLAVKGLTTDGVPGFGEVPGLVTSYTGTGSDLLFSSTSGGVTLFDPLGLTVTACSAAACADPTFVARINEGGEITFNTVRPPTVVLLDVADTDGNLLTPNPAIDPVNFVFELTSGPSKTVDDNPLTPLINEELFDGTPDVYQTTGHSSGINGGTISFNNPNGVAKIKIIDVEGGDKAGITKIRSFTSAGQEVHNITFSGTLSSTPTPVSFNNGRFFSEGTAPVLGEGYVVSGQSAVTDSYLASNIDSETYFTTFNPNAGVGGNALPAEVNGLSISSVPCSSGDVDIVAAGGIPDIGDGICDDWEGVGIPFTVTTGATGSLVPVDYTYPLSPTPVDGTLEIYYEIDAMKKHDPDDTALSNVRQKFTDNGYTLYTYQDQVGATNGLTHVTTMTLWGDSDVSATSDTNDYNSIKNDKYGRNCERPTISNQNIQLNTLVPVSSTAASSRTLAISGITVTTPNPTTCGAAYSSLGDNTQGTVTISVKMTFPDTNVVVGVTNLVVTPTPGGDNLAANTLNTRSPTFAVVSSGTTTRILTITVPYWTDDVVTGASLSLSMDLSFKRSGIAYSSAISPFGSGPGSPQIISTLIEGKAQVERYALWAHANQVGSSGQAEPLGNDLAVTLGAWGTDGADSGTVGTTDEQAGTFMHELGHNLNLAHGGPNYLRATPTISEISASFNCKPNYPSIMTYSRQLPTGAIGADWVLEYSDGGISSLLRESALIEYAPLVNTDADVPVIVWGSPVVSPATPTHTTPDHTSHRGSATAATIDWNDSGGITGSPTTVSANINHFGLFGCDSAVVSSAAADDFRDYNDWANLDLKFKGLGATFDGCPLECNIETERGGADRWTDIVINANEDTRPPGTKTLVEAKANTAVPLKARLVNDFGIIIETPTPPSGDAKGFVMLKKSACVKFGCVTGLPGYNKIGDLVWDPAGKVLKLVIKPPKTDIGRTYFIKIFLKDPTGGPDDLVIDNVLPLPFPIPMDGTETITYKFKIDD